MELEEEVWSWSRRVGEAGGEGLELEDEGWSWRRRVAAGGGGSELEE